MAKKRNKYDLQHKRNIKGYELQIDAIYREFIREAVAISGTAGQIKPDTAFSFDDFPITRKRIESLMAGLKSRMEMVVLNGIKAEWTLANNKNNELANRVFGNNIGKLTQEQYRRYYSTNDAARQAFQQRKVGGLNLSDRVWRYTEQFKEEIEMGLDIGIRSGRSADELSRDLRQYLKQPNKLFRRVRDEHGQLQLSKRAKAYHPGRGVYRSSYKNARRLAATETNIAYRTSDHLRWQQMDFVVGIEIHLSNNHTLNGKPFYDICDELAGKYPKDFKFTGWHPQCRCFATPILKTQEEFSQEAQRILNGEPVDGESVNRVRDVPQAFKDWITENRDRIEKAKSMPYFISDNQKTVDNILNQKPPTLLEKAASRHQRRTTDQVAAIQKRWDERKQKILQSVKEEANELIEKFQNSRSKALRENISILEVHLAKDDEFVKLWVDHVKDTINSELAKGKAIDARPAFKLHKRTIENVQKTSDEEVRSLTADFLKKHNIEGDFKVVNGHVELDKMTSYRLHGSDITKITEYENKNNGVIYRGIRDGSGYVQTNNSFYINEILRGLSNAELKPNDLQTIKALDAVIARNKTEFPIRVFRNVTLDVLPHLFGNQIKGQDLSAIVEQLNRGIGIQMKKDLGYMSCSTHEGQNVMKARPIQLQIEIPKGTNCFITRNKTESEIILGRGTQLEFISAETKTTRGKLQLCIHCKIK